MGSKLKERGKIAPFLRGKPRIIEPFAGTAFVSGTFSSSCILNDAQWEIAEIWEAARTGDQNFFGFASRMLTEENRRQELYYELRDEYNELWRNNDFTPRRRNLFFFLINACHGSMMRYGKKGFNSPFKLILLGDRMFRIEERLEIMREYGKKIESVYSDDAIHFLKKFKGVTDSIIYCDPPYINSGITYGDTWDFTKLVELDSILRRFARNGNTCVLQNYPDEEFDKITLADEVKRHRTLRRVKSNENVMKEDVVYLYGQNTISFQLDVV